jgi:hypothetical protein
MLRRRMDTKTMLVKEVRGRKKESSRDLNGAANRLDWLNAVQIVREVKQARIAQRDPLSAHTNDQKRTRQRYGLVPNDQTQTWALTHSPIPKRWNNSWNVTSAKKPEGTLHADMFVAHSPNQTIGTVCKPSMGNE